MENKFRKASTSTMSRLRQYNNPPEAEQKQAEQQRQAEQQKKGVLPRQPGQMKQAWQTMQTGQKNQSNQKKPVEPMPEVSRYSMPFPTAMESGTAVSPERLKEAVIWSEIIGKPVSKRRRHRF